MFLVILVVCFSICSLGTTANKVQLHVLHDSRLCNNGFTPFYNTTVCWHPSHGATSGETFLCDRRNLKPEECREASIEVSNFSARELQELIPNLDDDHTIRRVAVRLMDENIDFDVIGKEIDKFLTPRLWWRVHKEPYQWNKHSHKVIVLDKMEHSIEASLKLMSALQFPPTQDVCSKSPLIYNHRDFHHPGWYSMLAQYSIVHGELPFAITANYVSLQNKPDDSTSFVSGRDCPNIINKWECAFLPLTNCTVPPVFSSCTGANCVLNVVQDTRWASAIFDSTSSTGTILRNESPEFNKAKSVASKPPEWNPRYREMEQELRKHPGAEVKYIKPLHPELTPFQSMMFMDLDTYTYSFILRQSHFYRSRIQEAIHNFRIHNNFTANDRCVAAQIRRGDRTMAGVNITDYCLNTKNPNSDMGCDNVPFASVTLMHVVDSAAKLVPPEVRTVIVSTDDEEWLNAERESLRKVRPEWKVLNLRAPSHSASKSPSSDGEDYEFMRSGAGTDSGILLHGSIEASRQCEAFVGHFGCGGTMLVYKSLCAQHNNHEYICPPSFDVRTIEELNVHRKQHR